LQHSKLFQDCSGLAVAAPHPLHRLRIAKRVESPEIALKVEFKAAIVKHRIERLRLPDLLGLY
jgi:hypothetical protein